MQGYMCYKLQFAPTEYSFYLNTNSVFDQRKLFRFELNSPFDKGHVFLPVLHFNRLPFYERMINQEIVPSSRHTSSYTISYQLYEVTKLQAPYSTRCKYGSSTTECYDVCRDKEYVKLNYTHLHHILPEDEAVKDLKIAYFGKDEPQVFKSIRKECSAKCAFDPCEQKWAITHVSDGQSASVLTFLVETAHSPITKVVHIPRFELMDYCLQCFSWAGIFMGFSIMSTLSLNLFKSSESLDMMKQKLLLIRIETITLADLLNRRYPQRENRNTVCKSHLSDARIRRRLAPFLVAYTIATFILLLWQLSNTIVNYFLFETTWKFDYEMVYDVELRNTAICLRLKDLLSIKDLSSVDLNQSNYRTIVSKVDAKMNLTTADIFSSTPNETVLSKCRFRDWDQSYLTISLHNRTNCSKIFKLKKILYAGKMCYLFLPNQPLAGRGSWRFTLNPVNPGVIFSFIADFVKIRTPFLELITRGGNNGRKNQARAAGKREGKRR